MAKILKASNHTSLLSYALTKFLNYSPDITIVAKDGKLEINRLLLCMYSPTICSAISDCSSCSSTSCILLPDFSVASVWILIDLLILGNSSLVDLKTEWFQNVLDIANILQIQINEQNVQVIHKDICFEQVEVETKTKKPSETKQEDDGATSTDESQDDDATSTDESQDKTENMKQDEESIQKTAYEVTCKNSKGEFHHDKFISGGKGLCVLFKGSWMTPNQFEKMAGSKGKKYKESLKVDGTPIKKLIDEMGIGLTVPSPKQSQTDNLKGLAVPSPRQNQTHNLKGLAVPSPKQSQTNNLKGLAVPSPKQSQTHNMNEEDGESTQSSAVRTDELSNPSRKLPTNLNRYYNSIKTTGGDQVSRLTQVKQKGSSNPNRRDLEITTVGAVQAANATQLTQVEQKGSPNPNRRDLEMTTKGVVQPANATQLTTLSDQRKQSTNPMVTEEMSNSNKLTAPSDKQKQSTNDDDQADKLIKPSDHLKQSTNDDVAGKITTHLDQQKQSTNGNNQTGKITTPSNRLKQSTNLNGRDNQINPMETEQQSNATKLTTPKVQRKQSTNINSRDDQINHTLVDQVSNMTKLNTSSDQQKHSKNLDSDDDHINIKEADKLSRAEELSNDIDLIDEAPVDDIEFVDEDNKKVAEETVHEVTCKESRAEFHLQKFVSGPKGDCILFNKKWMTPNEFERLAGSKGKKYKETLRVNGKPLKTLIDRLEQGKLRNLNVVKSEIQGSIKLKNSSPRSRKPENLQDNDYNRNAASPLLDGVNMKDETMDDISNADQSKKRKRHSNESISEKNSMNKKIKLEIMQESSVNESPTILAKDDFTKLKTKTKAELKEYRDGNSFTSVLNIDEKNDIQGGDSEKKNYKCECGDSFNKTLLLKFHKSEDCVHVPTKRMDN